MNAPTQILQRTMPLRRQRGVALITAILLVALATALAAKLSWDNYLSMRRTESTLAMEQARLIALGAEATVIGLMRLKDPDEFDNPDFDHLLENWNTQLDGQVFTVGIDDTDFGTMQGKLRDATDRFNLNNVVTPGGPDRLATDQLLALISNLQKLKTKPLPPEQFRNARPDEIVDRIIDWIDKDTYPSSAGAEDSEYMSLETPYRPANDYFISPSELRAVDKIDAETYDFLTDYVTALPPGWCRVGREDPSTINLNTASLEVLEALDPTNGPDWANQRDQSPFETGADIAPGLPPDLNSYVNIKTPCFELQVTVTIGSSVLTMYSLLERSGPAANIYTTRVRTFGLNTE